MARYRVVRDNYAGFEAQVWRWWWPIWVQMGWPMTNTHASLENAINYIEHNGANVVWSSDDAASKPGGAS